MDTDLITVALGLAALIIGLFAWVRADAAAGRRELLQEIGGLRGEMRQEIGGLRDEMRQAIAEHRAETAAAFERLDDRLRAVEHGQAKLEGLLEGLREAVAGRAAA